LRVKPAKHAALPEAAGNSWKKLMYRVFKITAYTLAAALLLTLIGGLIAWWTFDPNAYKSQIIAQVQQNAGRTLRLEGNIELHLWPRLHLQIQQASLGSPADFPQQTAFVRAGLIRLDLELWPLLHQQIQLGLIRLEQAELNLHRRADGVGNWQDWGKPAATGSAAPSPWLENLQLGGLELADSRLRWSDAGNGQARELDAVNLALRGLALDMTAQTLSIQDLRLKAAQAEIQARISVRKLSSQPEIELQLQARGAQAGKILAALGLPADSLPPALNQPLALQASLSAAPPDFSLRQAKLELGANTLEIPRLSYQAGVAQGEPLHGTLLGMEFSAAPRWPAWNISIANLHAGLRAWLNPTHAAALAKNRLQGSVAWEAGWRFDLTLDRLNLDFFSSPATAKPATQATTTLPALPLQTLLDLPARGDFHLGELQAAGVTARDLRLHLE
jgi:uncharacterized protein involved in outer membrane biogenesis